SSTRDWSSDVCSSDLSEDTRSNSAVDWNRIEGNWKQFKGRAKEKWGRLTDDDLDVINGRQDQLEGKIEERYGLAKDQAKKDVEEIGRASCRERGWVVG